MDCVTTESYEDGGGCGRKRSRRPQRGSEPPEGPVLAIDHHRVLMRTRRGLRSRYATHIRFFFIPSLAPCLAHGEHSGPSPPSMPLTSGPARSIPAMRSQCMLERHQLGGSHICLQQSPGRPREHVQRLRVNMVQYSSSISSPYRGGIGERR